MTDLDTADLRIDLPTIEVPAAPSTAEQPAWATPSEGAPVALPRHRRRPRRTYQERHRQAVGSSLIAVGAVLAVALIVGWSWLVTRTDGPTVQLDYVPEQVVPTTTTTTGPTPATTDGADDPVSVPAPTSTAPAPPPANTSTSTSTAPTAPPTTDTTTLATTTTGNPAGDGEADGGLEVDLPDLPDVLPPFDPGQPDPPVEPSTTTTTSTPDAPAPDPIDPQEPTP